MLGWMRLRKARRPPTSSLTKVRSLGWPSSVRQSAADRPTGVQIPPPANPFFLLEKKESVNGKKENEGGIGTRPTNVGVRSDKVAHAVGSDVSNFLSPS